MDMLAANVFMFIGAVLRLCECVGEIRLVGANASRGEGELQYLYEDGEWASVCSGAVGVLDAQIACQYLEYPLLWSIGTVEEPAEAKSRGSITEFLCLYGLQQPQLSEALATVPTEYCNYDAVLDTPCNNTVHLECKNASVEDNALLVFIDEIRFWVIAPGKPLLTFCTSLQFYCGPTLLVSTDSPFFQFFHIGNICGDIDMEYYFGVGCTPAGEGDVCLIQQELEGCWKTGVVTRVVNSQPVGVCAASFGYLEAYVVCSQLGFRKINQISNTLLADYDLPSEVISNVSCNGSESSFNSCLVESTNSTVCTDVPYLKCSRDDFEGAVLIGVDPVSLTSFTVISPSESIYMENCRASAPFTSAGVLYLKKTLPVIQFLIKQLQNVSSCHQLGPIHLFGLDSPTTSGMFPTSTPNFNVTRNQALRTELAAIGVIVPFGLLVAVGSFVSVLVCRRYQRRRETKKIIEEIKNIHSNRYEFVRTSNGAIRPHRSVDIRRPSNPTKTEQDDLKIPFKCLTLDKEIGSGAYGSIYHAVIACEHQTEPIEVAVKVLKKMATNSERRSLQLEIDMLRELGCHRHLVSMLAWCLQGDQLALVLEYIPGGNLQEFLRSQRHNVVEEHAFQMAGSVCRSVTNCDRESELVGGSLTLTAQLQLARQITLGMEYLASKNVIHRDLAARNILVGGDGILKLADFGLSREVKGNEGYLMKGVEDKLPIRWMALESIVDRKFTIMSDVWAFGVVLWEIMTYAKFPFYHLTNREVIASVKAGERLAQPDNCPNEVYQIMTQCWNAEPLQRPTIRDVRGMLDDLLDTGEYMCFTDTTKVDPVVESRSVGFLHHSLPHTLNKIAKHHLVQSVK